MEKDVIKKAGVSDENPLVFKIFQWKVICQFKGFRSTLYISPMSLSNRPTNYSLVFTYSGGRNTERVSWKKGKLK